MSVGFRGNNQSAGQVQDEAGRWARKGPVPQRELVHLLDSLIDASKAKSGTRTRDEARAALRALMAVANWNTPYVLTNCGVRRCKYLAGLGYPVPYTYLVVSAKDRERLERLGNG